MVRNHNHHTFEPKYMIDYRVLKIGDESPLLLETPNGINDVKSCSTLELIEDAYNTLLSFMKSNCQNHRYNLTPHF